MEMLTATWVVGSIFTIINILILYMIWRVTAKYTKATEKMAELEAERKVWEVQPVLAPFNKFETIQLHRGERTHDATYFLIGVKNIGRGVASIQELKSVYPDLSENQESYTLPLYLGVGEEQICSKKHVPDEINLKFDVKQWDLKVKYNDIHGTIYLTSYQFGKLEIV